MQFSTLLDFAFFAIGALAMPNNVAARGLDA